MTKTDIAKLKNILNGSMHDYTFPNKNTNIVLGPAYLGINIRGSRYYIKGNVCDIYKTSEGEKYIINRIINNAFDCLVVLYIDYQNSIFNLEYDKDEDLEQDLKLNPNNKFTIDIIHKFNELLDKCFILGSTALIERSQKIYGYLVDQQFIGMTESEVRELIIFKILQVTPQETIDNAIKCLTTKRVYSKNYASESDIIQVQCN